MCTNWLDPFSETGPTGPSGDFGNGPKNKKMGRPETKYKKSAAQKLRNRPSKTENGQDSAKTSRAIGS